ncbi:MAG: Uma2 family endonuclease [Blastocatellia bacterium]|nr:Uma2 family endonuclease [Blastocatellia bacterium]
MVANIHPILTVDVLDAMPEDGNRYELIEGEIFVSRAPGLTHQRIMGNLFATLWNYLQKNPIGKVFTVPGVIFSNFTGVIPDLVYVSNERYSQIAARERLEGAPELVVEILSPGTENQKRDRDVKRYLYSKHGVEQYWIIDPDEKTVEVFATPEFNRSTIFTLEETLTTSLLPDFSCKLTNIFAE